ncbi:magnesium transporter [Candidatus Sumerlaeota bacterium]|nr:magnesium transporter [Candidatus Sumerlaeota bacterium]
MEPPHAVFSPSMTVAEAVEQLRIITKKVFVTYAFVADPQGKLLGVLVMRDLLLAARETPLESVMLRNPFWLQPEMDLMDAMKAVLNRHYPVYPVCDADGKLVGLIRGQTMFEQQAIDISAQAGEMVGVQKEERLATKWPQSLILRHPWLQLNLLTAFIAAGVVAVFQSTLDRLVILAVFLPVLAGQSGNTGCQALAVALRSLTLGELKSGEERRLILKEALLGFLNGVLVGISASLGMFVFARIQPADSGVPGKAFILALVTFLAMIGSCLVSGIAGATIPLTLKKLGADPATASSIFLTTMTDVASMGLFLSLATLLIR